MSDLKTICQFRLAVAFLGEKSQHHWWDTSFLNTLGFRYLGLIFPKTSGFSAITAASVAACRVHDERIGRGRVAHLFRLPPEIELRLHGGMSDLTVEEIESMCSKAAAFGFLDSIAGDARASPGAGPIRNGNLKDLGTRASLAGLAATYASGFRTGTQVFPYFA
jgi:hypothetical protein